MFGLDEKDLVWFDDSMYIKRNLTNMMPFPMRKYIFSFQNRLALLVLASNSLFLCLNMRGSRTKDWSCICCTISLAAMYGRTLFILITNFKYLFTQKTIKIQTQRIHIVLSVFVFYRWNISKRKYLNIFMIRMFSN